MTHWEKFAVGVVIGYAVSMLAREIRYLVKRYRHQQFQRRIIEERLGEIRNGRKNQDLTVDQRLLS